MRQILTILFFSILILSAFSQNKRELRKPSKMDINEAYTLLKKVPFNDEAINYICRYYYDKEIDSVTIFFDNLIKEHPNNIEPYLIRAYYLYFEHNFSDKVNYNKMKIKYLNSALEIDTSNKRTLYFLAEAYYNDFIYPLKKEKYSFIFDDDSTFFKHEKIIKKSAFEHSADSALKYFYKLWNIGSKTKYGVYFSIRQLECYLNYRNKSPIKEDIIHDNFCHFPPWYFANLSENWECDTTVDYLFELNIDMSEYSGTDPQLIALKEPCLYNRSLAENEIIFRFTWLRTFHHPIAIRLEKNENNIMLYWKVGKGMGGYKPKGLKISGKRKLTLNEWNEFINLFNNTNFDNLPNKGGFPMVDGASWTLERKTRDSYKAHCTNWASEQFKECCLFLLKLTNIKIKDEDEIY